MAIFARNDGEGNVTIYGARAVSDGQGHVTLLEDEYEVGDVIAEDEVSLALVDTSGYATHSEVEQTAESISLTVARGVVSDLEIGGRNLIVRSSSTENKYVDASGSVVDGSLYLVSLTDFIAIEAGQEYTFSRAAGDGDYFRIAWYDADKAFLGRKPITEVASNGAGTYTWTAPDSASYLRVSYPTSADSKAKLEKGSKATDWTPAPEDVEEHANSRVEEAMSQIQQLADKLSMLVTDDEGTTLLEQTSEGWTFNMASTLEDIADFKQKLQEAQEALEATNVSLGEVGTDVANLNPLTSYVTIGTEDSGKPYLALGNTQSEFKVKVTNTGINFMQGAETPAYINNQALRIKTAVVEDKLNIGGFSWYERTNGNVGIVWEGDE